MQAQIVLLVVAVLLSAVLAEPPFRRQQKAPQQAQQDADAAPYAPSGWKPAGQRLELPRGRAPATPADQYGPAEQDQDTTTDLPTTTVSSSPKTSAKQLQQQQQQGEYYVILPDGRLQRVQFVTRADGQPQQERYQHEQQEEQGQEEEEEASAVPAARPQLSQRRPAVPAVPVQRRPQPVAAPGASPARLEQQEVPSSFVAELRFMEVPPITGPVYSYSAPLVRVLREA